MTADVMTFPTRQGLHCSLQQKCMTDQCLVAPLVAPSLWMQGIFKHATGLGYLPRLSNPKFLCSTAQLLNPPNNHNNPNNSSNQPEVVCCRNHDDGEAVWLFTSPSLTC